MTPGLLPVQVHAKANQIAHQLVSMGLKPGEVVGVMADRSPELCIAMIAVLKAGGAYVPCDPTYPADRLQYMVQDSGLKILLTQQHLESLLSVDNVQVRIWSRVSSFPRWLSPEVLLCPQACGHELLGSL